MIRSCACFLVTPLLLVVTSVAAAQPPLPPRDLPRNPSGPATGVITGIVRAADSGAPLRGVDIRLTGTGVTRSARGAFTDASGRYEFRGLPEGQYTLVASKVRFMTMTYGQTRSGEEGRPVQVANAQRVENVDFSLPAGSVIVLRVGNRFGEPAVAYRVTLYQAKSGPGQRALAPIVGSVFGNTTDDRGEIRLSGLAPGEYYVSAGQGPSLGPGPREQEVPTFYPGTPAEADAQAISLGLGEEVVVTFNIVVARMSRISGKILGNARPDALQVERRTPTGSTLMDLLLGVAPDGSFSRSNLAPGEYVFVARNEKEFGAVTVNLADEDITGVVLAMKPVLPIRGQVTFEGVPPVGVAPTAFVVRPAFVEGALPFVAQYKSGWTFEIPTLRGTGVIRADPPRGWFLKSVLLDGRDVTDTVLDFETYQGKTLNVVLTQTATEINGRVVNGAGTAVPNYVAVAFPDDPQRWTALTRTIASARPDQQGLFSFRGLPPGRYLVAAVDYLQSGQERDPKTLERLRARATAVDVAEGATQNVALTLAP